MAFGLIQCLNTIFIHVYRKRNVHFNKNYEFMSV